MSAHPYERLTPEAVLDAVEACGLATDGRLLALNSYENRVYQVGIDGETPVVAKFYRPERWSEAQILEEHTFSAELAEQEIPVIAPLADAAGVTLHSHDGFRFALFPRRGGHAPELEAPETLLRIGRLMGRMHLVGAVRPFVERPAITIEGYGEESYRFLLEAGFVPPEQAGQFRTLAEEALAAVREGFARAGAYRPIRLHGDCHVGNILWSEAGPHFVDLDDCRSGPAVQDLWMLLSGDRAQMTLQLDELLEGYEEFADFDRRELHLVEPLRTLRLLHYAAWLARRWDDPAFPAAFPWFNTPRYWDEQVLTLREQIERLAAPALLIG